MSISFGAQDYLFLRKSRDYKVGKQNLVIDNGSSERRFDIVKYSRVGHLDPGDRATLLEWARDLLDSRDIFWMDMDVETEMLGKMYSTHALFRGGKVRMSGEQFGKIESYFTGKKDMKKLLVRLDLVGLGREIIAEMG